MTLSFPPFTRAIKILIGINAGIYFYEVLMSALHFERAIAFIPYLYLTASDVVHGHIYQLITYGFFHGGFFHMFFNMLMLWMFGSMLEVPWGSRRFVEFFLFGIVGAGIGTVALAYSIGPIVHLNPNTPTLGASGGIYAIFMATAMLFGDQEVFMFPFPFSIRLKYMVGILGFIALIGALGDKGNTANVAHLSGLLFGYLYVKFVPRRGILFSLSEASYGFTNRYHRWKRRRAGKKFQVYMRKHNQDSSDYFDEHGNFRPPEDKDKTNGGDTGGWVN
ncbi:MAG TPA: rhomboid family intramembrane serine protease [Candidatus Angelobacter sp.]|nr:rhomboid family intramembrane serine protease [Candidatus Angelobacter sp.]